MPNDDMLPEDEYGLLVEGRYEGVCVEISDFTSKSGNKGYKIVTLAQGKRINDFPMIKKADGSKMPWGIHRLHNFVFANGITDKRRSFDVLFSEVLERRVRYSVDVGVDGNFSKIKDYFPIEKEFAPMPGVPEEHGSAEEAPNTMCNPKAEETEDEEEI